VFIASPVLAHWKEREELYRRRRHRIAAEHDGVVPAYATAGHGVTVEPKGPKGPARRITSPDDPERGVSQSEFQQMVQDISHETAPTRVAAKPRADEAEAEVEPEVDTSADAQPEDLVLKDNKRDKTKRPRNKRHGRPR
jgi:SecD/SecF fusion protein